MSRRELHEFTWGCDRCATTTKTNYQSQPTDWFRIDVPTRLYDWGYSIAVCLLCPPCAKQLHEWSGLPMGDQP